jgi:hypothetical protein
MIVAADVLKAARIHPLPSAAAMSFFQMSDRAQNCHANVVELIDPHGYRAGVLYGQQLRDSGDRHFRAASHG